MKGRDAVLIFLNAASLRGDPWHPVREILHRVTFPGRSPERAARRVLNHLVEEGLLERSCRKDVLTGVSVAHYQVASAQQGLPKGVDPR